MQSRGTVVERLKRALKNQLPSVKKNHRGIVVIDVGIGKILHSLDSVKNTRLYGRIHSLRDTRNQRNRSQSGTGKTTKHTPSQQQDITLQQLSYLSMRVESDGALNNFTIRD
jgi:hypothetical protein